MIYKINEFLSCMYTRERERERERVRERERERERERDDKTGKERDTKGYKKRKGEAETKIYMYPCITELLLFS